MPRRVAGLPSALGGVPATFLAGSHKRRWSGGLKVGRGDGSRLGQVNRAGRQAAVVLRGHEGDKVGAASGQGR
jgi:hypothetical protein